MKATLSLPKVKSILHKADESNYQLFEVKSVLHKLMRATMDHLKVKSILHKADESNYEPSRSEKYSS